MCEYLKLKIEISMWSIWNLKIEMSKFGCVNIENWKLKSLCEMSRRNLKIEMYEYWKLKCLNIETWNVWILKIEMFEYWKLKSLIQTHYAYGQRAL
jgi:hypothetical protein